MTDQNAEAGFMSGVEQIENLHIAMNTRQAFDSGGDVEEFVQDTLYALSEVTATFESLQRIVAQRRYKVRVGDMFVMDMTDAQSPVITLSNLGNVFKFDDAKRIAHVVTRKLQQTAKLQHFPEG